jgi:hypothetical protein
MPFSQLAIDGNQLSGDQLEAAFFEAAQDVTD